MESQSVLVTTCGELELRWGERTYVMGILNVTPDSFSGDGLADDFKAAVKRAQYFHRRMRCRRFRCLRFCQDG